MNKTERNEIQSRIYEIIDRVEKNGRGKEIVRIKLDITLKGQTAINYKVLRLFASQISDAELSRYVFLLGLKSSTELLKLLAPKHGIQV